MAGIGPTRIDHHLPVNEELPDVFGDLCFIDSILLFCPFQVEFFCAIQDSFFAWEGLDYNYQKLKILESLTEDNYHYITDMSQPIYSAVSETMNKLSKKVVVFFTTGEFDVNDNFKSHDFEVCKRYAEINNVPFFIVNFTGKNAAKLKELANVTEGKYYN